jgi:hypothetical protein
MSSPKVGLVVCSFKKNRLDLGDCLCESKQAWDWEGLWKKPGLNNKRINEL